MNILLQKYKHFYIHRKGYMNIKKLDDFTNYNKTESTKKYIVLHTTGGHNIPNIINYWKTRNSGNGTISTHFIIGQDGSVTQCFDEKYWSHHTGLGEDIDKYAIGIEIENAGLCTITDDYIVENSLHVQPRHIESIVMDDGTQLYHESFPEAQIIAIKQLVMKLSKAHNIHALRTGTWDKQRGIWTHQQLNEKKTDIPLWMLEYVFPLKRRKYQK
jgi:N-acetyl-anhydromuramyl-L-alanine amidase AmpD